VDSFESPKALEAIRKTEPDLFVFAGGAILRAPLLVIPRLGTLNAHMGLLPFYRGMNVAEWACFHGDQQGCSVHLIDPGIDTGDILVARPIGIDGIRSISALRAKIDEAQMALLGDVVQYVTRVGSLPPRRSQAADEGRQFFRMHGELLELLERDLASGDAEAGRLEESEPVVSLSR
jgi:methionyl-tRNA formyltransferase